MVGLWLSREINCIVNDLLRLKKVFFLILKCVIKVFDFFLLNFVFGFVGDNFEIVFVFLFENFKEIVNIFDFCEVNDFFEMFVFVLFEFY